MKIQMQIDGKAYEVDIEGPECVPGRFQTVQSVVIPSARRPGNGRDVSFDDCHVCRSPVAGIVVRVNVRPGAELQANDPILVLESMKMENNLTAAAPAKVKSVNVAPGEAVRVDQILVEFE